MTTAKFSKLNTNGQEVPDDEPIVLRVNNRKVTKFDEIRSFIQRELSQQAVNNGQESFEEANDFDVDDDPIPQSPHEYDEDTEAADLEVLRAGNPRTRRARPPSRPTPAPTGSAASGTKPPLEDDAAS